jgi:hypothetical protein
MRNLKLGIIKAYHIPMLPENVLIFYNNPFIRMLRVIGGLCVLLVLTKKYVLLPFPLNYFSLVFAVIQLFQIIIISIIKIVYSIKKLRKNPEEFEIRNSPLNHYASHFAKLAYCWKVGCIVSVSIIVAGVTLEKVL